jgi:hypothetical protein
MQSVVVVVKERALGLLLIAGATAFSWWTLSSHLGLFHDDGIYVVTAKALAEGRGYHILSIPTNPLQTKYPPFFPMLLALVWRIVPAFPENVGALKLVGVACFSTTLVCAGELFRKVPGFRAWWKEAAFLALCAFNALSMSLTDFTLSDHAFAACVAMATLVHCGESQEDTRVRPVVVAALVAVVSMMTRQAGVAVLLAGIVWAAKKGPRSLAIYSAIAAGYLVLSIGLRASSVSASNPLLTYYTAYELPAMVRLALNVPVAARIVLDNTAYALETGATVMFFNAVPGSALIFGVLIALGLQRAVRAAGVFLPCFVVLYVGQVLLYPFVPGRYLLPLVAPVMLCLFHGIDALAAVFAQSVSRHNRDMVRGLAHAPLVLLVLACLTWASMYAKPSTHSSTRIWLGLRAKYGWAGFEETFSWLRSHTDSKDVLATAFDPMYYLYTGRVGVRPWFHQPWTYFYPRNNPSPDLGSAQDVQRALDQLGATLIVVDPLDGFVERAAAEKLIKDLLSLYGPRAVHVFSSSDGFHQVFRVVSASDKRR